MGDQPLGVGRQLQENRPGVSEETKDSGAKPDRSSRRGEGRTLLQALFSLCLAASFLMAAGGVALSFIIPAVFPRSDWDIPGWVEAPLMACVIAWGGWEAYLMVTRESRGR